MASVPLALSVHNLISSVGADAGFAAVIGLAILALLYFAHARETANLREEAAVLAQRLQDAEAKLDAARRVQPAVAVAPAPEAAEPAPLALPFAPAGVAAPALTAATRVVRLPDVAPAGAVALGSIKISRAAGAPVPPDTAPPETAPVVTPAEAEDESVASPAPVSVPPSAPVPSPPPAPPAPIPSLPVPAPAPAAVTAFRTAPATVAGGAGAATGAGTSNGSTGGTSPPPTEPPLADPPVRAPALPAPEERDLFVSNRSAPASRVWRRLAVLVGLVIVIGAVVAVIVATSDTGTQNPSGQAGSNSVIPIKPAFDPADVTVAVLNGTNTNQLAHHVADRLSAEGFKKGTVATASNQTLTSTVVAYMPGKGNRKDALHVAKTLKLSPGAVAPIDQAAQAVACPPPGACDANVVVTVGANLAATY